MNKTQVNILLIILGVILIAYMLITSVIRIIEGIFALILLAVIIGIVYLIVKIRK